MLSETNIFLIGPMGSGKTAVGRHLARAARRSVSRQRCRNRGAAPASTSAFIFEKEGEAGFVSASTRSSSSSPSRTPIVLATGGGAVLRPDNRQALATRGCVVYLQTSVHQQLERTRQGRHRPLLLNPDPQAAP